MDKRDNQEARNQSSGSIRERCREAKAGRKTYLRLIALLLFFASFAAGFTWYTPHVYAPVAYVRSYTALKQSEDTNVKKLMIENPKARRIMAEVSAYLPMDPEQSSMTGLARDGNPAIPFQTIAVDPRVVPFYSWVYVPDVGWFIAHDTGSAIKGNKMDICVESYTWAMRWGRRTLEVVVIEPEE